MGDEEMPVFGQPLEISLASRSDIHAIASEMVQHYIEHLDVADLIQRVDVNPISIQAIDAIENDGSIVATVADNCHQVECEWRAFQQPNFTTMHGNRIERFDEILDIINGYMFKGLTPTEMYINGNSVPNPFGASPEQREYELTIRFVGNERRTT